MSLKSNQKGFGAVEVLLVLILIGILGGVGFYVYNSNKKSNQKADTTSTASKAETKVADKSTDTETVKEADANLGYLVIKEWGVKIKLRDSMKVSYTYSAEAGNQAASIDYQSSIKPVIKPEFLQDKTCEVGAGVLRSVSVSADQAQYSKKIGNQYYTVTGAPGACSDNPQTNPDDQLKQRILQDLTPANIEQL